jgi:hypothetical protein
MTGLPGAPYTMNQASYDLSRLAGRADRPRPAPQLVHPDPDGLKFAVFYTKFQTAFCARSWPATSHRPRRHSARHVAPSTPKSAGALTRLVFQPQPDPTTPATSREPWPELKIPVGEGLSKDR